VKIEAEGRPNPVAQPLESAGLGRRQGPGVPVDVDPGRVVALIALGPIGSITTVSAPVIRSRSGSSPGAASQAKMSASAMVAVGSSPCICDQSSTVTGPVPLVTVRSSRPCIDRPTASTTRRGEARDGAIAFQYSAWVVRRSVMDATR
jgi:hypothetical protein